MPLLPPLYSGSVQTCTLWTLFKKLLFCSPILEECTVDTKATCRPCCLGAKLYVNTYKTIFHFTFFFSIICKFVFETAQSKLVLEFIIIK